MLVVYVPCCGLEAEHFEVVGNTNFMIIFAGIGDLRIRFCIYLRGSTLGLQMGVFILSHNLYES